jgi:hypothetical protein
MLSEDTETMDAGEFKRHMEQRFGIRPDNVVYEDKNSMVRVFSKQLMSSPIKGSRGYPAFDGAASHYFATMFGHLAMRNFIDLKKQDAEALVSGKSMKLDLPDGEYIGKLGNRGVCTIEIENRTARAHLPKLLKRNRKE